MLLPIIKPGKDASKVSSYRPIALLSCLGKEIKKLAFKILYAFIENKNYSPFFQCGFKTQHSCLDTQIYLENYIQLSLRKQKVLLIVSFDIQKAFDSSSHTSILFSLLNKGI